MLARYLMANSTCQNCPTITLALFTFKYFLTEGDSEKLCQANFSIGHIKARVKLYLVHPIMHVHIRNGYIPLVVAAVSFASSIYSTES